MKREKITVWSAEKKKRASWPRATEERGQGGTRALNRG